MLENASRSERFGVGSLPSKQGVAGSSPAGRANFGSAPGFWVDGLKREELVAMNSPPLHELHFECLGPAAAAEGGRSLPGASGWRLTSIPAEASRRTA